MERWAFYRTIWRWHFYAGLFVIPFVVVLSATGALYLFKPQVERWEERAFQGQPTVDAATPEMQVAAALAANPGSTFVSYRLPEREGDAAKIHLSFVNGAGMRDVFVSPQGRVLGSLDPDRRIMALDQRIHGQLLMGKPGSWLVELAASWAIVLILTGLYLWWPRGRGLAGVVWPRLGAQGRPFWRDLHAVAGFWVSGLALVLLVSGMPWADAWGSAFKTVRSELGWTSAAQDWTIGGRAAASDPHAEHDHTTMGKSMPSADIQTVTLDPIVAMAMAERLAFPVIVTPSGTVWTVRSEAQNRPLRVALSYDARTGVVVSREGFADKHPIDRIVGYGIAWHEGQLFGWLNQLVGLATALLLMTLVVSGFVMWRGRKPDGELGAPPLPEMPPRIRGVAAILVLLAAVLPLLALSMMAMWAVERLVLVHLPNTRRWLGLGAV